MSDVYVMGIDMIRFGRYPERSVPDLGAEAAMLAMDDAGNFYVTTYDSMYGTEILRFTPDGVGSVFATPPSYPSGLAFDSEGYLWAAIRGNNTLMKFTPTGGVESVFADASLDFPSPIAIQVPEPAALSLLALGLGALAIRKRRRS